jgi:hypothetical protein
MNEEQIALLKNENKILKRELKDAKKDLRKADCEYIELVKQITKNDELKEVSKKLYGVVLHIHEIAKTHPVVVIGPNLFEEACASIKFYEKILSELDK